MTCRKCKERGKNWVGDEPVCAFESGKFSEVNWNCATMNELRDKADVTWGNDDQNASIIPIENGQFIILSWYKNRGRTEGAWIIDEGECKKLTIKEADKAI